MQVNQETKGIKAVEHDHDCHMTFLDFKGSDNYVIPPNLIHGGGFAVFRYHDGEILGNVPTMAQAKRLVYAN